MAATHALPREPATRYDKLAQIAAIAIEARHKFEQGLMPTGRTALRQIEELATDALVEDV